MREPEAHLEKNKLVEPNTTLDVTEDNQYQDYQRSHVEAFGPRL